MFSTNPAKYQLGSEVDHTLDSVDGMMAMVSNRVPGVYPSEKDDVVLDAGTTYRTPSEKSEGGHNAVGSLVEVSPNPSCFSG